MKLTESVPSYQSNWLKSDDLGNNTVKVTIRQVTIENIRNPRTNKDEPKGVAEFEGKEKRLILAKSNAVILESLFGDIESMVGQQVLLKPNPQRQQGEPDIWVQEVPVIVEDQPSMAEEEQVDLNDIQV